jgi:hypothetical protein
MGQAGEDQRSGTARPAALLAVRISPADIGSRVSVRHRIVAVDAHLTDVVGHLREWVDGILSIEAASGALVRVHERDVVAAKVVPPRKLRANSASGRPDPGP